MQVKAVAAGLRYPLGPSDSGRPRPTRARAVRLSFGHSRIRI